MTEGFSQMLPPEIEAKISGSRRQANGRADAPLPPLNWAPIRDWDNKPRPETEWAVPDRIPLRQAMLLSGEGGGGKSTIMKQLCVATVLGRDWLGSLPVKGPAFFIEAEDDERILHVRLDDIRTHYESTFAQIADAGLRMLSRAGDDAVMAAPNRNGRIEPTAFYSQILEMAREIKPKIIAIASAANVFAGNEINRAHVMQFGGLLVKLAIAANGSVVLASHPSLTGINTDTGLSGTTQWHNAFRARSYLKIPKPEDGEQPDPDLRELKFLKNQYGRRDDTIRLHYQKGLFLPLAGVAPLTRIAQDSQAESVFLECLAEFAAGGRRVSATKTAPTYAPTAFASTTKGKPIGKKRLQAAMDRLFDRKAIRVGPNPDVRPSKATQVILRGEPA